MSPDEFSHPKKSIAFLGKQENYHGHVTALSIAPEFRRIGVSSQLMALLEKVSEQSVLLGIFPSTSDRTIFILEREPISSIYLFVYRINVQLICIIN